MLHVETINSHVAANSFTTMFHVKNETANVFIDLNEIKRMEVLRKTILHCHSENTPCDSQVGLDVSEDSCFYQNDISQMK
ncbi:CLUMA_CG014991, isoform A [Clunio marinus]|uniref:CLUMA_CG014991, isoform A n=1 Tax=Clunio marinus TaxID=568069 RepID=A0A1J1ING0_9DIPT|nr:CLUMA_CG014991, isoform A [Clunio marinus]